MAEKVKIPLATGGEVEADIVKVISCTNAPTECTLEDGTVLLIKPMVLRVAKFQGADGTTHYTAQIQNILDKK